MSSLEEIEEETQLGLILVWALPNIKKEKSGRELRFLVNVETKTQNSRLFSERAVQYGDILLPVSWKGGKVRPGVVDQEKMKGQRIAVMGGNFKQVGRIEDCIQTVEYDV